ncbi:unnamed protein product, partial [Sphacelaria rigidula]
QGALVGGKSGGSPKPSNDIAPDAVEVAAAADAAFRGNADAAVLADVKGSEVNKGDKSDGGESVDTKTELEKAQREAEEAKKSAMAAQEELGRLQALKDALEGMVSEMDPDDDDAGDDDDNTS